MSGTPLAGRLSDRVDLRAAEQASKWVRQLERKVVVGLAAQQGRWLHPDRVLDRAAAEQDLARLLNRVRLNPPRRCALFTITDLGVHDGAI